MDGAKQDAPLAEQVGDDLRFQSCLERVGRTQRNRPRKCDVGGASIEVLLDGEARVDAGAVHLASLFVQPAH